MNPAGKNAGEGCLFVIFGATGDLMRRKLLPTLFQLAQGGLLPERYRILGVARDTAMDDGTYAAWAGQVLADAGVGDAATRHRWCAERLHFQAFSDTGSVDFLTLAAHIVEIEGSHGLPGNRVLYMALPPTVVPATIAALAEAGLTGSRGWTRLLIEKPFGHDLDSARRLNEALHGYFDEAQIYRVDHYLGKETVQNLLAFRFGNAIFESAWNREHIKSVQLTVAEEIGVEGRAAYYEGAGALRDIVQNHLTQLLTLTAMEVPAAFDAESIRHEKIKVLRSVSPIAGDAVVFGQYGAGWRDGRSLPAYRNEPGVDADSRVDTFVALGLAIENWRWQGVPFYLRTGKRLARRSTQIVIEFRGPPIALFSSSGCCDPHTNLLTIRLQPDEGFDLSFEVKSPGSGFTLETRHMEFRYAEAFGTTFSAGYETLLLDVLAGDQTLFVHADEAEASWRLYQPLLQRTAPPEPYPAGSWGPAAADRLPAASGMAWINV